MTLTLTGKTPNALKYVVGDNNGLSASIKRTALIEACMAGPLRAALQATSEEVAWAALPSTAKLSIYTTPADGDDVLGAQFNDDDDDERAFTVTRGNNGTFGTVEIRFWLTPGR